MTGDELIAAARARINDEGGDADDPRLGPDYMRGIMNKGARVFYRRTGAGARTAPITLAAAGATALPADFSRPRALYNADGRRIAAASRDEIVRWQLDTAAAPTVHVVYGGVLYTAPATSVPYVARLDYYARPAEIVDLTLATGLVSEANDAVIEYMVFQAGLTLGDREVAAAGKTVFDELCEDADFDYEEIALTDTFSDETQTWSRE